MPRPGYRNTRRHFVDVWTMAGELKLSVRRIQQLAAAAVLVRSNRGEYWLEGNLTRYETYLRRFQERKGYVPWTGFRDERTGEFVRIR
jgi:hypothetical protein